MFWKVGPSGLSQLEISELVRQLHYAAPVSSSSLFRIDMSPFPFPGIYTYPFTFSLLITLFTLPSRVVRSLLNLPASSNSHFNRGTILKKTNIKYGDHWQHWKIPRSVLTTIAINNHLLCFLLNSSDPPQSPHPPRHPYHLSPLCFSSLTTF